MGWHVLSSFTRLGLGKEYHSRQRIQEVQRQGVNEIDLFDEDEPVGEGVDNIIATFLFPHLFPLSSSLPIINTQSTQSITASLLFSGTFIAT